MATKLGAAWRAGRRKGLSVGTPASYAGMSWFWNPARGIDVSKVRDGLGNSAVTACFDRKISGLTEAPVRVYERIEKVAEPYEDHPLESLLAFPNETMVGAHLWGYTVVACDAEGDAYWYKERTEAGRIVELYPLLPSAVTPGTATSPLSLATDDPNRLITHYEYRSAGKDVRIEVPDIVHLRTKLDPKDHRRGFAPLKTALREVMTDEEANLFTASLVKNTGMPGVILTPESEGDLGPTEPEADAMVDIWKAKTGGSRRGEPFIPLRRMKVQTVAFTPEQMEFSKLARIPEERISAVLGVPAVLAGLGAGLERSTYSNVDGLREYFTESTLSPLWRLFGAQVTRQLLLPDFESPGSKRWTAFDLSEVRALQEDENDLWKRNGQAVRDGYATVADARRAVGLEVDDSHNVFLRGLNTVEVPADGTEIEEVDKPVPTAEELEELIR